ncbi:MAG: hypothetical protein EZS28_014603 [Streblomastix strix]|uniref:Uncharacterized protein n=1 Tax=Streblomastix strix TaxID=222440 RepID=A0A5J4W5Z8_9EUKA|nr:MAG: hypothetical protein EZS28_014603 [Streblomastix strix]
MAEVFTPVAQDSNWRQRVVKEIGSADHHRDVFPEIYSANTADRTAKIEDIKSRTATRPVGMSLNRTWNRTDTRKIQPKPGYTTAYQTYGEYEPINPPVVKYHIRHLRFN